MPAFSMRGRGGEGGKGRKFAGPPEPAVVGGLGAIASATAPSNPLAPTITKKADGSAVGFFHKGETRGEGKGRKDRWTALIRGGRRRQTGYRSEV